ncbi:MAG: D-alanyl-D-alanine carboxypeptidase family protein, partial [Hyphomonadaceae bacterium]
WISYRLAFAPLGAMAVTLAAAAPAWADDKYSAIVIDTQTNEVLHADQADSLRYPASLTKMMTLYMLFDALERGDISLNDRMVVSRHAAVQAPTKLGLRAGKSIRVEDAIKAVVTKSANDAAVVIAERLGGTESRFAARMTAKAHDLGMTSTNFANASGLPDARQRTTARDMAVLGEKLFQDHPKYYSYFQTPGMRWGKRYAPNHNRLLGRVEGVDGIKTGYTNASGYNLASSVTRNGKRLVAVVMGGETGASRDAQVAALIENAYQLLTVRGDIGATATLTSMPVNRAAIDVNSGVVRSELNARDQAQYTSVVGVIAGAAAAAASVIAPNASAATPAPVAGAPITAAAPSGQHSELDSSPGLY